jgi:hypothetical protein
VVVVPLPTAATAVAAAVAGAFDGGGII